LGTEASAHRRTVPPSKSFASSKRGATARAKRVSKITKLDLVNYAGWAYEQSPTKSRRTANTKFVRVNQFLKARGISIATNADGGWIKTCSILTTTPNAATSGVHDRMPVILAQDSYDLWLDPGMQNVAAISELLKPYDARLMRSYPISSGINHVERMTTRSARDAWRSPRLKIGCSSREASLRKHRSAIFLSMSRSLLLLLIATCGTVLAQNASAERNLRKPGIKEVQVPFAYVKPTATIKVGGTADWVLVTDNAVWVASTRPYAVLRIDPTTNKIVATVTVSGEACSGLATGFGSIWVPVCGEMPELVRIDCAKNTVSATLPVAPAAPEGGIAISEDSVWMVSDKKGTLVRVDPSTNSVRERIFIPPGSFNPVFSGGTVWISGITSNVLTAVDASSGKVLASIPVGPKPRFLTAGGGSIWTLNQGDGSVSRVDEKSRKVIATIQVGIPGTGGDIGYGADFVWSSVFEVPLTRIDAKTNRVTRQWVGKGGDSLRFGFDSLWITDYKKGLLSRIPIEQVR
jgi:virginiamycin B lyase